MKKSRWLLVFNLLVVYVFLQFIWWSVLIAGQLHEIYGETPAYHKKLWMIFGEGLVFLLILFTGVYFVRRSFKREIEINNQQKNFLLAVTHELKTPIAVTKLSLQTLANRPLNEERKSEIIHKAIQETDRLNDLIDNIMLVVKLDEKNIQLKLQKTNLSNLLQHQLESIQSTIGIHHRLISQIEPEVYMNIDQNYFISIIENLYSNAIKYSPENSTITVKLLTTNGKINLIVTDEGLGVNDHDKTKIFERFYRSGNEETRIAKGTGLGLFITKNLVEMHNGTIHCQRNQPKGTSFIVQF